MPPTPTPPTLNAYCPPRKNREPAPPLPLPMKAACTSCISTVPSGTLPLTASGPRATFPVHPASHRQHTLTSTSRDTVSFAVCLIIGTLLVCKSSVSLFTGCGRRFTSHLGTYHTPSGGVSPARTQAALPRP